MIEALDGDISLSALMPDCVAVHIPAALNAIYSNGKNFANFTSESGDVFRSECHSTLSPEQQKHILP